MKHNILDPSRDEERHREFDRIAPGWRGFAHPKPEKRSTTKGSKDREEDAYQQVIRDKCVTRDGDCRLSTPTPLSAQDRWEFTHSDCRGESELAHILGHKRSKTRGMPPEQRHDTSWCAQLCSKHHHLEEIGVLIIEALSDKGADGPLKFRFRPRGTP